MSKIELDDQILIHPKFIRAARNGGSAAIHMWLGLRAYCAQQLTDGHIPVDMLDEVRGPTDSRSRKKAIDCLADSKLLHRTDTGWYLHDYLDHASSREQVLAWRAANTKRKRESRSRHSETHTETLPVTPDVTHSEIPPSVPVSVREPSPSPSPSPSLSPSQEEEKEILSIPPEAVQKPKPDMASMPKHIQRFESSMTGNVPGVRPDVLELHAAWKSSLGMPHVLRHSNCDEANFLLDSIKAHGLSDCLLVAKYAPSDGMVNGTLDEQKVGHPTIKYIFGNEDTFCRILANARKKEPVPGAPTQLSQLNNAYNQGRR